ncbi:hypothetical protein GUITHDRAFT_46656, partial [Guillardia theta CCMP2712]
LDDRLKKAIAHMGWQQPTLIQTQAIPLALQGKDILAKAKTGSGKTGAYALPILQKILQSEGYNKNTRIERSGPVAVVLVPTRELVEQVRQVFSELCFFVPSVTLAAITADQSLAAQKSILLTKPHVLIATPSRLDQHVKLDNVLLRESTEMIVLDEADLLLSFGFEDEIKSIAGSLPNICQCMLMSATLSEDTEKLQALVMNNPVTLKAEDNESAQGRLAQFSLRCSQRDKFLISYVLLKLGILQGKVLFFVNDVDRCYELKLFLEQFSIRAAVLNSELPQNSRMSIIQGFNRGFYNYEEEEEEASEDDESEEEEVEEKTGKRDLDDYGVMRGVDFKLVDAVVNFELPRTLRAYTHRVGRTARAGQNGTALSLVSPEEVGRLEGLAGKQAERGMQVIEPLPFNLQQVEGFRYRAEDSLRRVTKLAIKRARLREIESELLNSKTLKEHFQHNPQDLRALRHDRTLAPNRQMAHLAKVPDYLLPPSLRTQVMQSKREAKRRARDSLPVNSKKRKKEGADPLKTFQPP